MIVIKSSIIPFKGYKILNFFGILFHRKGTSDIKDYEYNHENIHTHQMRELGYIFFYILYVLEWLFKLIQYGDSNIAYRDISFEREAYSNQYDPDYLVSRKHYAQWRN